MMSKNGKIFLLFLCLVVILFTGCAGVKDKTGIEQEDSISSEKGQESVQTPIEKEENTEKENTEKENTREEVTVQNSNEDEELEKSLEEFREERETMTDVSLGTSGARGYGAPNMEEFGITSNESDYTSNFDARELNEAYEAAKKYVEKTLSIKVETKISVYPCVDPRITEIYSDEDKGVANGYTSDNIFVCEYCDEGIWKYLILVREAKGEPWSVIHHGSSYKE